jgi:addiction module HigA family antidote
MKNILRKRPPSHPGALLREIVLAELGITQGELARRLEISRRSINMILNEKRPVTTDMAIRFARVLGSTPRFWLSLQQAYDIHVAQQVREREYRSLTPLAASLTGSVR